MAGVGFYFKAVQILLSACLVNQSNGLQFSPPAKGELPNANHIFNTVHSSLRQWGSSYHHNGMSFFLATVPKGTQFYHGSPHNESVTGREWLAFEPEHAMMFADAGVLPPKDGRGNTSELCEGSSMRKEFFGAFDIASDPFRPTLHSHRVNKDEQTPLRKDDADDRLRFRAGWLHTYAAKHDLHMIYIDGMSAAKSYNGTLDTQDYILLNETDQHSVMWDLVRADRLCDIAKRELLGRIDGFVRMEGGFELILCSFESHLDTLRITRAKHKNDFLVVGEGGAFAYFQALSSRYHGVGKQRVRLNYDSFVTAYEHPINFFSGTKSLPRLSSAPFDLLSVIRNDLRETVMASDAFAVSEDWQAIADMIVLRYSPRLGFMISGASSANRTLMEVERLLQPFIDYDERNPSSEIVRCQEQFLPLPHITQASLAGKAIAEVSRKICSALVKILYHDDHQNSLSLLTELVEWLDWSTWKECKGCAYNEICFITTWPIGAVSDRDSPICIDSTGLFQRHGYWGPRPR